MPGNRKITKKAIKGKEDIHPGSRKGMSSSSISNVILEEPILISIASQLTRVQLRSSKLIHENKNRRKAFSAKRKFEGYPL